MSIADIARIQNLDYQIDPILIAIGNRTWQTKNISSVAIVEERATLEVPDPTNAATLPPKKKFYWIAMLLGAAVAWIISISVETSSPVTVGWLLTVLPTAFFMFVSHYNYKFQYKAWSQQDQKLRRQHKVWEQLRNDPPRFYNINFDSSSGRVTALTALDENKVKEIHSAILNSMRGVDNEPSVGKIGTLDTTHEKLEHLVKRYYDELIKKTV